MVVGSLIDWLINGFIWLLVHSQSMIVNCWLIDAFIVIGSLTGNDGYRNRDAK